jgi:hypothetical protein
MSFKKLIDAQMKHGNGVLMEDSPKGWKGTVKAMKKHGEVDNPYALGWWMKNKGYKSHKKADGTSKEAVGYDTVKESEHLTQNVVDGVVRHIERNYPELIQKYGLDKVTEVAYQNTHWLTDDYPEDQGFGSSDSYGPVKDTLKHFGIDHDAELERRRSMPRESIRVNHPVHGNGTVEAITESHITITWDRLDKRLSAPNTIAFADAKYLTRIREEYTDDPEDALVGRKKDPKMVKKNGKKKIDESMVAIGMTAIGGTHRGGTEARQPMDEIIRFEDLLEDGDDWNKPWEDDGDDTDDGGDGTENHAPEKDTTDGADYTNVPRPADSILTNQDDQPSYSADPLSTKAGFDAAGDGGEPDGDYMDINPVDAPDTPQVRDLEGSSDRGNTRDAGDDSNDTSEADAGDYDESKPEDNGGEDKMKNESAWLDAEDLGIDLNEMSNDPMGGMDFDQGGDMGMQEHDMGSDEIAFTGELLDKLVAAIASRAPDEATLSALCAGLKSAQAEKGDAGLGVEDWDAIKSAAAAAYSGGGDEMGGDEMGDPVGDDGDEGEEYDDDAEGEDEYEDQAAGDGEIAGPEGGEEHEGKTQMMDCEGDMYEKKVDREGRPQGQRNRPPRQEMKRRKPKKSQQYENKGGTPIGTGSTSGSGGGNQKDLSKPKAWKGKPVGTGTSGPGGGSTGNFGQKPTKDGGANNLPEYEKGSQLGADSTVFDGSAESPAPRNSKPLAAEGKKNTRKKLDEAIMLGMSSIPGTVRGGYEDVPSDVDWDDEIKSIKRLAGMPNWWQD